MYVCVLGVGGCLCSVCVGSVTGEVTPERRRAHNARLYLVYSRDGLALVCLHAQQQQE